MNICLIRPSTVMRKLSVTLKPTAPLGLAYIAASLKEAGHYVKVVDAIAEKPHQYTTLKGDIMINGLTNEEIANLIPANTEAIGITCMFTNNWLNDRALIDYLGERFPDKPIFAGGEHITGGALICLKQTKHLKVCVLGEGEETVVKLLDNLQQDAYLQTVEGIAYKTIEGNVQINPRRQRIREIDRLPWPAWELFPIDNYREHSMSYGVVRHGLSLPIMATRGCPYECTFCSSPQMWGTRYYMRKPKDVVDEIIYFQKQFDTTNYDFYDLTAILNKRWIVDFCQEILNRNVKITWQIPAGTRSEVIDAEVARYLYKTGCRNITYAPESGSEEILNAIQKKVHLPRMLESFRHTNSEGINIKLNMLIGLPEERHRNIWETIVFLIKASKAGVHDIFPTIVVPYTGCKLYDNLVNEGKIDPNSTEYYERIIVSDSFWAGYFYNEHINPLAFRLYRILYLLVFYSTNYLFHPNRFFKTLNNLVSGKPQSRAEQRVYEVFKRATGKSLAGST